MKRSDSRSICHRLIFYRFLARGFSRDTRVHSLVRHEGTRRVPALAHACMHRVKLC